MKIWILLILWGDVYQPEYLKFYIQEDCITAKTEILTQRAGRFQPHVFCIEADEELNN